MPLYLGVDPDTKHGGWAVVAGERYTRSLPRVVAVGTMLVNGHLARFRRPALAQAVIDGLTRARNAGPLSCAAVEWPYLTPAHRRPADIIELAASAGMVCGVLQALAVPWVAVLPVQWKGSVPKDVHQPRILDSVQLDVQLPRAHRSHVVDAIGLALHALRRNPQ